MASAGAGVCEARAEALEAFSYTLRARLSCVSRTRFRFLPLLPELLFEMRRCCGGATVVV